VKISSILDIVDGKLLNSPSISFIYSIKTNPKKVKECDLFIAKDGLSLQEAINNGAFAIICEGNFTIYDNEIAWIKVENLELAIIKLVRFKLSTLNLEAYFCNDSLYDMFKIYQNSFGKNIFFIPSKIEKIFSYIDNIKDGAILVAKDQELLNKIYPKNKKFEQNIDIRDISNLVEHSLFETSFSYKNHFFQRIKISSLYIKDFIYIFNLLEKDMDLSRLNKFLNMKAIFINKNLEVVEYGKNSKFIITQENISLLENEIKYVKSRFKYAKTIFISKNGIDFLEKSEQTMIGSLDELKEIVKNMDFQCIYLADFNHKDILGYFKSKKQPNLF